ncbi:hypothetical protein ACFSS8_22295 [Paracoccus kondratievae]
MQNEFHHSRRAFLCGTGGLMTASAVIGMGSTAAAQTTADSEQVTSVPDTHYYLTDVRLEDGFEHEGEYIAATLTGLYTLEILDGAIAAILDPGAALTAGVARYSAGGGWRCPLFATCISIWTRPFMAGRGVPLCRVRAKRSWT